MDANELRNKTPDQLRDELAGLKKEAFNLRFQQANLMGQEIVCPAILITANKLAKLCLVDCVLSKKLRNSNLLSS